MLNITDNITNNMIDNMSVNQKNPEYEITMFWEHKEPVTLDFNQVTRVSEELLKLLNRYHKNKVHIIIHNITPRVKKVLKIAGLNFMDKN